MVSLGGGVNEHSERYRVLLTVKNQQTGLSGENVAFKVLKSIRPKSGNDQKWGSEEDVSESLGVWKLRLQSNNVDFQYPNSENSKEFNSMNYRKAECKDLKNVQIVSSGTGQEVNIEKDKITLSVTENNSCRRSFWKVECDITISSSQNSNLKWNNNFKPKVVFSPF